MAFVATFAQQEVTEWLMAAPLPVSKPQILQNENLKGDAFTAEELCKESFVSFANVFPAEGHVFNWPGNASTKWEVIRPGKKGFVELKPTRKADFQLAYLATYVESRGVQKLKFEVESPQMFEIFLNGEKVSSSYSEGDEEKTYSRTASLDVDRGKYLLVVKSFRSGGEAPWRIKGRLMDEPAKGLVSLSPREHMNIHHLLEGTKLAGMSLSPSGKMVAVTYSRVNPKDDKTSRWTVVKDIATGKVVYSLQKATESGISWMPRGEKIWYTLRDEQGSHIWMYDLANGKEKKLAGPFEGAYGFRWSADEKFMIYSKQDASISNKNGSLLYMDDLGNRTFRARSSSMLYYYDMATGVSQRLTWGKESASLHDISRDGRYIVFSQSKPNPTQRPFSLQTVYLMDLEEQDIKTLWENSRESGFASFSPDGKQLLVSGGPDLFGEVGLNIGDQPIANNYDNQLYLYTLADGSVEALTENFNPSIGSAVWHPVLNQLIVSASDEIYGRLYNYNFSLKKFEEIPTPMDVAGGLDVATEAAAAVFSGTGVTEPNKGYFLDLESGEYRLLEDIEAQTYARVDFGKSEDFNFTKDDGTVIKGYVQYPPDFDPSKKYPLIVNYYGGTSPVEKSFGGRYPKNIWCANGYVVYVPQPSGATGFGQEFAARHQNNWGITTADEIIEGTQKFLASHDFIDADRIGCIGASYGGFMTMLLQTRTDLFACAISHAGISSISSYWGEGYWGYAYSANATGDSYPWNRRDIYVEQSPLFHADKITTPLLLLHGSVDTNVPLGESLQLWVALKILGRPVEMVQVEGQDHHILTYHKRVEWHHTILAWFNKWLKDEGEAWSEMFPNSAN